MPVPPFETARLLIRPLAMDDLEAIHQILDVDLSTADFGSEGAQSRDDRAHWLQWTIMSYAEQVKLYQPPYGERAVVLKQTGELIGAIGYVPCLAPFEQLPGLDPQGVPAPGRPFTTEFGLFYALAPAHHRRGYATEAARAMIDYAFRQLRLKRIVATTTYDNAASIGVMRKLGMRIEKNPFPDPPWLQVVGVLENG